MTTVRPAPVCFWSFAGFPESGVSMIEFQKITDAEGLSSIRAIADEVWPETFAPILSPEQIVYMMKMMYAPEVMEKELANGFFFDLLTIDGVDAGYMVYAPYEEPETMKLHKLYLLEEFQGKGFGQKMLHHVAEEARKRGFKFLILAVNKQNTKAQKAYERFGFKQYKAVQIDIGNGFIMDDYWLRYSL